MYGYLKKSIKAQVDAIVDELAQPPAVAECYEAWNKLRDDVEGYYTDKPREHLPLSQQKEFKAIKNMVIREAEQIRLGEITFEDEQMDDALAEEEEVLTSHTHRQKVNTYRKAKYVLCDDDSTWAEQEEAVHTLEQLWNDGFTAAAHQLGKCWRDGLGVLPDDDKAELWLRRSAETGNDFPNTHWASFCRTGNESRRLSAGMKRPPHRATSLPATGWVSSISWGQCSKGYGKSYHPPDPIRRSRKPVCPIRSRQTVFGQAGS